eukprot:56706-Chlamydomonas_euryale.AAC.1
MGRSGGFGLPKAKASFGQAYSVAVAVVAIAQPRVTAVSPNTCHTKVRGCVLHGMSARMSSHSRLSLVHTTFASLHPSMIVCAALCTFSRLPLSFLPGQDPRTCARHATRPLVGCRRQRAVWHVEPRERGPPLYLGGAQQDAAVAGRARPGHVPCHARRAVRAQPARQRRADRVVWQRAATSGGADERPDQPRAGVPPGFAARRAQVQLCAEGALEAH